MAQIADSPAQTVFVPEVPYRIAATMAILAAMPLPLNAVLVSDVQHWWATGFALLWLTLVLWQIPALNVDTQNRLQPRAVVVCSLGTVLALSALILGGAAGYPLIAAAITMIGLHLPLRWGMTAVVVIVLVAWPQFTAGQALGARLQSLLEITAASVAFFALARLLYQALLHRTIAEQLNTELQQTNRLLRNQVTERAEWVQQRERTRIAQDLHDSLGHALTALHLQLQLAQRSTERDNCIAASEKALALTRQALSDLRCSVSVLRVATPDLSLEQAIRDLLLALPDTPLQITFTLHGEARPLSADTAYTLYRAVQEGLTNTLRHAAASHLDIVLDFSHSKQVRLLLRDDGQGCDDFNGGLGLAGIRERVTALSGEFNVTTQAGCGLQLQVEIPG